MTLTELKAYTTQENHFSFVLQWSLQELGRDSDNSVLDASNTENKIVVANSEVRNQSAVQEVSHQEHAVVMVLHLPTCKDS